MLRDVKRSFPLLVLGAALAIAGCGPDNNNNRRDIGIGPVDGGGGDAFVPDGGPAVDADTDSGTSTDGGPGDGGNSGDVGMTDGGVTPDGGTTNDAGVDPDGGFDAGTSPPVIFSVSWEFASDGSCSVSSPSGMRYFIAVRDEDNVTLMLEAVVVGSFDSCTASMTVIDPPDGESIRIDYANCNTSGDVMPTITVTDPDGNSDSVTGFTVTPCVSGVHFPS